ncbi:MAG: polysaccharide biosynthesis protein [Clostridiales bacterium]|nr:polysaccharide biosynthesis protein [Clostridiales bacterium]
MTQKQKTLVGGVSILGLAGLICKVVGVLYRIPLAHLIDPMGMAIYHKVFPAYNLLLTISSAGIPVAISRMVSHYVTKEEPQNAKRIFRIALYLLCALGLVTTLLLMLFSGHVAAWQGTEEAMAGYLCIAPSLFFVCLMSAYRGYMQGRRHMLPTAISQLIEQVGKVAVALPLAALGMHKGGVAWGAAGALLGSTIGEGAALFYMMYQHKRMDHRGDEALQRENMELLSGKTIARRLVAVAIPITLGACIVPLAGFIDSVMLTQLMEGAGMAREDALIRYGAYSGPVLTLINVPTALAMAMSTNLVPSIAAGMARGDQDYVASETNTGLRMASVIGFPCSIGMSVLAQPLLYLCYRGSYTAAQLNVAAELLTVSSLTIVLFTMVQATSGILQGAGKQRIPMYTLLIGVILKIALNYTLVRIPGVDIHGAPFASLLCYTASMIPNLYFVCKYTGCRFSFTDVVAKPLLCSLLMGAIVWAIWHFIFGDAGQLAGPVLMLGIMLCVVTGIAVYALAALKLKAIRREDLPARIRRFVK